MREFFMIKRNRFGRKIYKKKIKYLNNVRKFKL